MLTGNCAGVVKLSGFHLYLFSAYQNFLLVYNVTL